jgi:hypothetical protein
VFSLPHKDGLIQVRVNRSVIDFGVFQPAYKLSLLTGGLCLAGTMDTPYAQVDTFLQKYTPDRPGKGDQAAKIVKMDSSVQNHVKYGTIKREAVRHCSSPGSL